MRCHSLAGDCQLSFSLILPSPVSEVYRFFSNRILSSSRTFMLCRMVLVIYFVVLFFISLFDENMCFLLHSWTKISKQSMRGHCDGFNLGYTESHMKPRITTSIEGTHFSHHLKKIKFEKSKTCSCLYYQY